jgi:NAD(P)-dependent dehydrogenase (short-subunit alcohol dehydrogenase family)
MPYRRAVSACTYSWATTQANRSSTNSTLAIAPLLPHAIAPGLFATEGNAPFFAKPHIAELARRIPLRRFGRPDELVGAAIFLASDAASSTDMCGRRGTLGGTLERDEHEGSNRRGIGGTRHRPAR